MAVITYRQAAIDAVAEAFDRDPRVWALGEDIGRGGTYGQYGDLGTRYADRVVSTPISEATIMGAGVGAALVGTRPIVELRAADFALCAVDEMINQAAKARYMFGGQARCPVVIRQATGLRASTAAQHSQSFEAWYVHVPGLVVLAPATPADNKGLLTAAIEWRRRHHRDLVRRAAGSRNGGGRGGGEGDQCRGDRPAQSVALGRGGGVVLGREDRAAGDRARGGAGRRVRRGNLRDGRRKDRP
jgi:transketolase C-terminal domain/subunit